MRQENRPALDILHGWKEIADYLRKGIRTVQRYDREFGLPIHRIAGQSRSVVFATKAELDAWVSDAPIRTKGRGKRVAGSETNRLGVEFLRVDSEIALTFSGIALGTNDKQKKIRAARTARKAYESIMRLRQKVELTEAERAKLDDNLQRLKSELQRLGEIF